MRHITYECDWCQRQYEYHIKVNENDRGILLRLPELGIEICAACKKKLLEKLYVS